MIGIWGGGTKQEVQKVLGEEEVQDNFNGQILHIIA